MLYDVVFYVAYPYYYPHFLPIYKVLKENSMSVHFILSEKQNTQIMQQISDDNNLEYTLGEEKLQTIDAKVIVFANVPNEDFSTKAKTIFLCHGTGTKQCGFEKALERCDIVLVEGDYRFEYYTSKYHKYRNKIKKVGYSKLDPIVNITQEDKNELESKYAIDSCKKTILYAPTFFPSSIEKMSDSFPDDFKECNILIKPHYLSWERKRYRKQREKFEKWKAYDNCTVLEADEYSIIPFLLLSDVMISDESSAIFEFASLNKPVIVNRFLKLRWSYYLSPKKLLKRMDKNMDRYRSIGANAKSYAEMLDATKKELKNTSRFEKQRLLLAKDICGKVDGKASHRIVEVIKEAYV